jgi:hypothetical protein
MQDGGNSDATTWNARLIKMDATGIELECKLECKKQAR